MRVIIVVVNWNGAATLKACLASLADQTLLPERVVLVDNASTDGSLAAAVVGFPSLAVIANDANLGYGYANNQGIELALAEGADAVLLVNNDATLAPDMLERLVAALDRDPHVGIVGPRVLLDSDHDRLWSAGGLLTYRQNLTTLIGHRKQDEARYRLDTAVDYVPGCVMLIRSEVFEAIGLIEPDYFAYMEDVDFCVRAREQGFGCRCIGEAEAYHWGSASTGGGYTRCRKYMMGVNSVWFLRRFGRRAQWLRFIAFDVLTLPAVFALELARGRARAVWAKGRGILDGFRGLHVNADLVLQHTGGVPRRAGDQDRRALSMQPPARDGCGG